MLVDFWDYIFQIWLTVHKGKEESVWQELKKRSDTKKGTQESLVQSRGF